MKFSVKDFFSKWSNTLKQVVGNLPTNCLSVFDHFKGLNTSKSHEHDDTSIYMVKICDSSIVKSLSLIPGNCPKSGIFPID